MNLCISAVDILQAISALAHSSSAFILFVKMPEESRLCKQQFNLKFIFYYNSIYLGLAALWLQIHAAFYRNKIIQQNVNKCFYYIHILLFPLFFFLLLLSILFVNIWPSIVIDYYKCECILFQIHIDGTASPLASLWRVYGVIPTIIFIFIKACLLLSFIIPLYLHRRKMIKRGIDRNNSVYRIIKRLAIIPTATYAIHVVIYVFTVPLITSSTNNFYLANILTNFLLFLYLIETIITFANWRYKLFPFTKKTDIYIFWLLLHLQTEQQARLILNDKRLFFLYRLATSF